MQSVIDMREILPDRPICAAYKCHIAGKSEHTYSIDIMFRLQCLMRNKLAYSTKKKCDSKK